METAADTGPTSAFEEARRLVRAGDDQAALRVVTEIARTADEPRTVARALTWALGCRINIGRTDECPTILDRAFEALDEVDDHALRGDLHALAGILAEPSSTERCIRHLVQSSRQLDQVGEPSEEVASAWHNLAVTYSFTGFHAQARAAAEHAYRNSRALELSAGDHSLPEVLVRQGVALDHRGDTEGCVRTLREVVHAWSGETALNQLWIAERVYYDYAAARLAVLDERPAAPDGDSRAEPDPFTVEADTWEVRDLRLLGSACVAITRGRPRDALTLLSGHSVSPYTLGAAELPRVRALAHAADGDLRAAHAADREAVRVATTEIGPLRDRLVDGTRAQLDNEALGRTVRQYASEALTDPLTGLPNRRHFDRRVAEITGATAVGVIDLDGFKTVNTVHGHLSGDLVLRRVAAILARTIRQGDFLARYGGDEFVALLPGTDVVGAHGVGSRLSEAVAAEEWDALVTGTPVSVTIGWAELTEHGGLVTALEAADRTMLERKQRRADFA